MNDFILDLSDVQGHYLFWTPAFVDHLSSSVSRTTAYRSKIPVAILLLETDRRENTKI